MTRISILLPTYNGDRFLDEQVDTILAQTDGDFEVLALDDGSSDTTVARLDALAARDPRMRRLPSSGNTGQNARLVELMGHARGEFIAIADQDDRWAPDRNARLLAAIGTRPIAFGRSELIDAAGSPKGLSLLEVSDVLFRDEDVLLSMIQPMFSAHAMLIRRSFLNSEAFFNVLPFDWLLALEAQFAGGIVYVDDAVVFHRQHDGNQHNNFHNFARSRRFTRSDLGHVSRFRLPERMKFWQILEHLGRARSLSAERRKLFHGLARDARTAWFSEFRPWRADQAALRRALLDALGPFAGSPDDLVRFRRHIDLLTRPAASAAMIGEVRRRLRQLRPR